MAKAAATTDDIPFPHLRDDGAARDPGFVLVEPADDDPAQGLMELGVEAQIAQFIQQLQAGRDWFDALLDCIRDWQAPREIVNGREYVYLIEQEAFDWLLLAERICDAAAGHLPSWQVEALLIDETPPTPLSEAEFQERLGTPKYWAHLNFLYGVRVEQALHLAMERVVRKASGALTFSHTRDSLESDAFGRIYGARQADLLLEYRASIGRETADPERIEHAEWQAFTYWLFRRRLERQDPARVASDTRQGLEMLYELEAAKQRRRRRRKSESQQTTNESDVIDGVLVAVG